MAEPSTSCTACAQATHRACRNHAPLDVTKGICHRTKALVPADGEACAQFQLLPRCANCRAFEAGPGDLGVCNASTQEPRFFAYADLVATTCVHYRAV